MRSGVWRRVGMQKDHGLAALQFFEDRFQDRIAQRHPVGVREQHNTIELENIERVRQLLQRRVNVRQRETSDTRKPVWPGQKQFGREFIAAARQGLRFGAVSRVLAGRTQRHDRDVDASFVHERNASFLRSPKRRKSANGSVSVLRLLPEKVRQHVVMGVDRQWRSLDVSLAVMRSGRESDRRLARQSCGLTRLSQVR